MESDDFVLKDDSGAVDGIAYVIETYGIIYNKALLKKYCEMDGAVIKSADEINNFETLKKVADDIQAKKDDLGVDGAFTSAGFDSSSDWRFKTHLANLPIYYEYKEDGITSTDANACNRAFSFSDEREACTDCARFFCGSAFGSYLFLCRLMKREIPGREIVMPCFSSMA